MLVYLISSMNENERISHIAYLEKICPKLEKIEAIYPSKIHIPFYNNIKKISKQRTEMALSDGAIGCLLSHRKTWNTFLNQQQTDHCLILESDSKIENWDQIINLATLVNKEYDLFFWGAFDGRMKLFKSTLKHIENFQIGTPYNNSLYCTYGYMINKTAANYLLKQTSTFNYPVDYWKLRLKHSNLKIGGILPNLITTKNEFKSTIAIKQKSMYNQVFDLIIDLKNTIITKLN